MKLDARLEAPKLRRSPGAPDLPAGTRNTFDPRYRSGWSETDAAGAARCCLKKTNMGSRRRPVEVCFTLAMRHTLTTLPLRTLEQSP